MGMFNRQSWAERQIEMWLVKTCHVMMQLICRF